MYTWLKDTDLKQIEQDERLDALEKPCPVYRMTERNKDLLTWIPIPGQIIWFYSADGLPNAIKYTNNTVALTTGMNFTSYTNLRL